jgi:hypothetical protein
VITVEVGWYGGQEVRRQCCIEARRYENVKEIKNWRERERIFTI